MEILILILLCGVHLPHLLRADTDSSELRKRASRILLFFALITGIHQSTALCDHIHESRSVFPETAVKAAFIYNMTKFISWPMPQKPLTILIMGDPDLATTLRRMTANEKGTAFKILDEYNPSEPRYHIIFKSRNISPRALMVIQGKSSEHSLFMTDNELYSDPDQMVYISQRKSRLILHINTSKTNNRQIYISPQLLNMSKIITTQEGRQP